MDVYKNPYVIGAAAIGFVALVALSAKGGGSGNSASSASLAGANSVNVALAGLTAQQNIVAIQGSVAETITAQQISGSLAGTVLAGVLSIVGNGQNAATARTMQQDQIRGTLALDRQRNAFQLDLLPTMANIDTNKAVALAGIWAPVQIQIAKAQSDASVAIAGINANAASHAADMHAASSMLQSSGGIGGIFDAITGLLG